MTRGEKLGHALYYGSSKGTIRSMPELPDITIYVEAIRERVQGLPVERVRILMPFVLRSVEPSIRSIEGKKVVGVKRMGKRIVLEFETELFLVIHLMIAGRLLWKEGDLRLGRIGQAVLEFPHGSLVLTEAGSKKRASITLLQGEENLNSIDPGGLDIFACALEEFRSTLQHENRTLKRALTQPQRFDGIGNAYSDEILHAARLSPLKLTRTLSEEETLRLFRACQSTLKDWIDRLRKQFKGKFPGQGQITAFRPEFAAHGKFGQPCPICGSKIQRIRYAENETNYCANCQNEGRLLADRSLSRLLKSDWPKTLEEMEGD